MKIKSAIRKLCEHCKVVKSGKKIYIKCKADPRHKQRQGRKNFSTLQNQAGIQNMNLQEFQLTEQQLLEQESEMCVCSSCLQQIQLNENCSDINYNYLDKIYLANKIYNPIQHTFKVEDLENL
ncbi:Ribosomal protein L36 [Pseudocohnilembus persalinus]|uniref:Ribosomal protein n=1 Tax=Pseudocohnilembus persalinus TaxID=266149 RepID=A0A0V0QP98_PSEPJ|nr:Ribosomal protein L36 [Pseudocohnilembus persalinus]|eukprot:KRX04175.1 Ribosomal protein L36 [Pseudocohnilembus persalinus]